MNKRGMSLEVILALVLGVGIVLLLLLGPLKGVIVDKAIPFFQNLPGFDQGSNEPIILGNVRYNIAEDKVERYDGERWNSFGNEVKFATLDKEVSESDLKQSFNTYYFDASKRDDHNIYRIGNGYWALAVGLTSQIGDIYPRGSTITNIVNANNNIVGTYYVLSTSVFPYSQTDKEDKQFVELKEGVVEKTIVEKTIIWRDSILKNPISIQGKKFCVSKIDHYLNINLDVVGACNA